jgi:hypothetical protein
MPALANSPKAWRSWYDQLHKLSKSDDVSTTELKQLIDDPPLNSELTKVAAEDMTPTDVSESFCLTEVHGPRHGSFHVHSFSSGQILVPKTSSVTLIKLTSIYRNSAGHV